MGWAKYTEDNLEIMIERQFLMETRNQPAEIKNICSSILPLPKNIDKGISQPVINPVPDDYDAKDTYIMCKDCGTKFLFSSQAQKRFKAKGWDKPKRCNKCRVFRNTCCLMSPSF